MFNVGGGEVLVIAMVALIVLGPQRLPQAARQVAKAMGELRRLSTGFQNEVRNALEEAEVADTSTAVPKSGGGPKNVLADPSTAASDAFRSVREQAAPGDGTGGPDSEG